MKTLSIKAAIGAGWEKFKGRPGLLIGALLLSMLIQGLFNFLIVRVKVQPLSAVLSLVLIVVQCFLALGYVKIALNVSEDREAGLGTLFAGGPYMGKYLVATLLYSIALFVGFLLLIVPGIFLMVALSFYTFIVLDRNAGPVESLKAAWGLTRGARMDLFLFFLALLGLNVLGMIPVFLGLLVTAPLSALACAHAYRQLAGQEDNPPAA